MLFPGEAEALVNLKQMAADYGYGNLIHHLSWWWGEKLMKDGLSPEAAAAGARMTEGTKQAFLQEYGGVGNDKAI